MMGYVVLLTYSFNTRMLCMDQALCKALPICSEEQIWPLLSPPRSLEEESFGLHLASIEITSHRIYRLKRNMC